MRSIKTLILIVLITCYSLCVLAQSRNHNADANRIIPPKIDSTIRALVEIGKLPSLQIALVSDNKIICLKSYGKEANKNAVYKIGSIEKVITSTALLQLHENGKINIYEDVNKYLPFSVRNPKFPDVPISVITLMSHRSGLEMFQYQFEWDTRELGNFKNRQTNNLEILNLSEVDFFKTSLDTLGINFSPDIWKFKPETNFIYSNSGYLILHFLIEQVSGQTYSEYVTENIFQKIGMNHSVFSDIDSNANFSNSYTRKDGENIKLTFLPGMYSNAEDLAKFMIAHMNNGQYNNIPLLQPETIELMHKKHSHKRNLFDLSSRCPFAGYGLGIIYYGNNLFGHGGSTIGYQSLLTFSKSDKSGYVILTNVNGLLHGGENYDSVWSTVSPIEKLLKSELGYSTNNINVYVLIVILVIMINTLIFLKWRVRIKKTK